MNSTGFTVDELDIIRDAVHHHIWCDYHIGCEHCREETQREGCFTSKQNLERHLKLINNEK